MREKVLREALLFVKKTIGTSNFTKKANYLHQFQRMEYLRVKRFVSHFSEKVDCFQCQASFLCKIRTCLGHRTINNDFFVDPKAILQSDISSDISNDTTE